MINVAQSARARRETYVGPWLPGPVDASADPALGAERGEAREIAVVQLLEKVPPKERAAYVLSEAFDHPYERIADVLETSEANARQLASRARKHLAAERRDPVSPAEQRRLLGTFLAAAERRPGKAEGPLRLASGRLLGWSRHGASRDGIDRIVWVISRDELSRRSCGLHDELEVEMKIVVIGGTVSSHRRW